MGPVEAWHGGACPHGGLSRPAHGLGWGSQPPHPACTPTAAPAPREPSVRVLPLPTPWLRSRGRKECLSFLLKGVCVQVLRARIILTQRLAKKCHWVSFFPLAGSAGRRRAVRKPPPAQVGLAEWGACAAAARAGPGVHPPPAPPACPPRRCAAVRSECDCSHGRSPHPGPAAARAAPGHDGNQGAESGTSGPPWPPGATWEARQGWHRWGSWSSGSAWAPGTERGPREAREPRRGRTAWTAWRGRSNRGGWTPWTQRRPWRTGKSGPCWAARAGGQRPARTPRRGRGEWPPRWNRPPGPSGTLGTPRPSWPTGTSWTPWSPRGPPRRRC